MEASWPASYFGKRGIYYGWVIIAVMFITLFVALGFRFAFGVFYSAILDETGWSRADTAMVVSASMIVYACTAALSGYLYDRLGARVLFPIGAVLMGAGMMLCSRISSLPQLVLAYGVMLGLSYAALGFIPHMAIVPRWFDRRRGLAAALSLAGVGMGTLVIAWISAELIVRIGWRSTLWYFGIVTILLLIPLNLIFHRPSAASIGLQPDGLPATGSAHKAAPEHNTSALQAMRQRGFWLLFLAVSMIGFCTFTMVVHQTRLLVDLGFSLPVASLLFGLMGGARSMGGLIWGPLSDRMGRAACVTIICIVSVVGLLMLTAVAEFATMAPWLRPVLLAVYMVTFGIGYQGMSPVYASAVSDLYAGRNLGTILGLLDLGFGLGSALGPWWAGWMFDHFGNYLVTLIGVMVGVGFTGIGLAWASKQPAAAAAR